MGGHNCRTRTETLTGEWTVARAPEIHALARSWASEADVVELNCEKLGRVDLSFLQVLLALRRDLVGRGGALRLVAPAESFLGALRVTGLDQELLA